MLLAVDETSVEREPLLRVLGAAMTSAVARSGDWLACRPGCAQCCHGVFEITATDAERLRVGLAAADAAVRERVLARVAAARGRMEGFYPGDAATGVLGGDAEAVELFEEGFAGEACPVLDPVTHTCDLYGARPVLCRTFGPPVANDHEDTSAGLAVCELCFDGASEEEVARCAVDTGFRVVEEAAEEVWLRAHPGDGASVVAFAFREGS